MRAQSPFFILILLFSALPLFAEPLAPGLVDLAAKAGGVVTPAVREAFLAEAERRVVAELGKVGVRLTPAQSDFLRKDPEVRAACFGAVWPPDPRIALNLLEVRDEVGLELYQKYRSFLVAGSVARRHVGVGEAALGEKEEWALRGKAEAEAKGVRTWPAYGLFDLDPADDSKLASGKKGKEPRAAAQRKREQRQEERKSKEADADGLRLAAAFLAERKLSPAEVMGSAELRKGMLAAMGEHAPKARVVTQDLMQDVMVAAGLRPPERDPFPSLADYCRYLASADVSRFPLRTAPWPLLMPLAKGWPLREAADIGRRVAESKKLPTYGKYQGKEAVNRARLQPSPWNWNSWQGTYQAGGVCHEMSTLGVGTYVALGVPATKTGQPHHSCVTIFTSSEKGYSVQIKQGTRGPVGTHSQWLFADPKVERPLAYHMGLALSMNVGLQDYLDTRIALNLAGMTRDRELAELILSAAAKRNPFNTEVWVALRDLGAGAGGPLTHRSRILRLLCGLAQGEDGAIATFRQRPTDASLADDPDEPEVENPKAWSSTYVSTVAREFLLEGLEPGPRADDNARTLENLRACRGKGVQGIDAVLARFEKSVVAK